MDDREIKEKFEKKITVDWDFSNRYANAARDLHSIGVETEYYDLLQKKPELKRTDVLEQEIDACQKEVDECRKELAEKRFFGKKKLEEKLAGLEKELNELKDYSVKLLEAKGHFIRTTYTKWFGATKGDNNKVYTPTLGQVYQSQKAADFRQPTQSVFDNDNFNIEDIKPGQRVFGSIDMAKIQKVMAENAARDAKLKEATNMVKEAFERTHGGPIHTLDDVLDGPIHTLDWEQPDRDSALARALDGRVSTPTENEPSKDPAVAAVEEELKRETEEWAERYKDDPDLDPFDDLDL